MSDKTDEKVQVEGEQQTEDNGDDVKEQEEDEEETEESLAPTQAFGPPLTQDEQKMETN